MTDETEATRIEGAVYVCTLPDALGRVTRFVERNGRLTAETASGIDFIIPTAALTPTNGER